MHKNAKTLITIAGPTAVGKTGFAIALAKRLGAEIFSADSRQVYQELNIGVAKPTLTQLEEVKHHFIGNISIHEPYDVASYVDEMNEALKAYFEHHDVAILCGGTGLYIDALHNGIDTMPDIPTHIREHYQQLLTSEGLEPLQDELRNKDIEYYNVVDKQNPRRVLRALEVIAVSGEPFSNFRKKNGKGQGYRKLNYLLEMDREQLYHRINYRVDNMINQGLLEEVKNLMPYQNLKALQTVGYTELFDYLEGKHNLETAVELIKRNSRRYAKRQMTWFRKYGNWKVFRL